MESSKTGLSAGSVIRALLIEDQEISGRVTKIFPVVTDKAETPYIAYHRAGLDTAATKQTSADTAAIVLDIYTSDYTSGLELAEAVRASIDNVQAESDGLRIRRCILTNATETFEGDAFIQRLFFDVKM